ncbi:MAG: class I SAM-dependent methyltransferase [Gemmatimonadaceae bacterium]
MNCRHCETALHPRHDVFVDLGSAPPSNAFLRASDLDRAESYLPLKVFTCSNCRLVQVDEIERHDALFSDDYVYFSSYSSTWLAHADAYVSRAVDRLQLNEQSLVVEVASNDGYLLQFVQQRGIPCVGIEPTTSTAQAARARGIESIEEFFGEKFALAFAESRRAADLIVGNNVLAHVPDINDFVAGLRGALAPTGTVTVEFPHLLQLVHHGQFDTVYHEHFSYLSLHAVRRVFASQGLEIWDVEELPTHGGSLRVWAQHASNSRTVLPSVEILLSKEAAAGMLTDAFYRTLQPRAERIKDDLLAFLIDCKRRGKRVMGYGAAAKGNTLMNFAGIRADLIDGVADASPHKQGRFLPGSRIPVVPPSVIDETKPDYIVIFPWNIRVEVESQLAHAREWGAQFVTAVPELRVA